MDTIEFSSGDDVKAGQLLVRLRSADDVAHLDSLKATAALAETNYKRDKAQFEAEAISQAVLDTDAANLRSAKAQVVEQQALRRTRNSCARPLPGRSASAQSTSGQYLAPGTKIVTLQQLDPIFVDFSSAAAVLEPDPRRARSSARPRTSFPDKTFAGEISALDPEIDTDTRNVRIRAATLKNPDHRLLPGMYAKVGIEVGAPVRYLTLPQTAVAYNPYGATVYVVAQAGKTANSPAECSHETPPRRRRRADLVAKQVFVTTGTTRGDQVAILKGINEGDEVVTSGQIKLRNGALITVNNSVQPSDDPNPKPQEH